MHITYTDEQTMLRDSAEKFLRENYSFAHRQTIVKQALVKNEQFFSAEIWQTFADLGWLMLPFSEDHGGLGGGAIELMLMGESFGRNLVLEPFLETIVLVGGLLQASGNQALTTRYLEPLMTGNLQGAFAYGESGCGLPDGKAATIAVATGEGYCLSGSKSVVFNGPASDIFIVSAADENGSTGLFLVPKDSAGLTVRNYPTYDGRSASELVLDKVLVPHSNRLCAPGKEAEIIGPVLDLAMVFLCAEAVGAMDALVKATVEYTAQRKQFGQPIAKFQVLRHRMVDMYMETELCRSLLLATAWHVQNKTEEAAKLVSALKAKVGKSARYVSQNAIQLHGGIGVTDELSVGHYFKRLAVIENLFGARDYHLRRYHLMRFHQVASDNRA